MAILTIDIETTVKNAEGVSEYVVGDDKASPFHPENRAVLVGYKANWAVRTFTPEQLPMFGDIKHSVELLVGQNIRFDLHYLVKHFPWWEKWLHNPKNKIWDTQLAEYLLTAQQHKYASLDELSEKYGLPLKDDKIKAYWESGVQTEDIPVEELTEYLKQDVENTYQVYLKQRELAEEIGMVALIESQMRALVATWEMSKNGMCFDYWRAVDQADKLQQEIDKVQASIQPYVDSQHPLAPAGTFSITSNDVLGRLLFGGTYGYAVLEPTGEVFKTGVKKGQPKTKKVEKEASVSGLFPPRESWRTKKAGTYMVGDEIVQSLVGKSKDPSAILLLDTVRRLRALTKDRNTYFVGFSQLAWRQPDGSYRIHGKLNHCSTDTGRLSSSSPNMQNVGGKER